MPPGGGIHSWVHTECIAKLYTAASRPSTQIIIAVERKPGNDQLSETRVFVTPKSGKAEIVSTSSVPTITPKSIRQRNILVNPIS